MRLADSRNLFSICLAATVSILAVMAGGASGTLIFQWLDTGLAAPVSPGSLLVIFANAPYPQLAGVSIGIAISTFVTFICAAILLKLPNKEKENKTVKEREKSWNHLSFIPSFCLRLRYGIKCYGSRPAEKKLAAEKSIFLSDTALSMN